MRLLAVLLVLGLSAPVRAADPPCTTQDYSDPKKAPSWRCPGPGEGILVPDLPARPSKGIPAGAKIVLPNKTVTLDYDGVLMSKNRVLRQGLRIKGLRRLRWLDRHKGAELLDIEKKYVGDKLQAKLTLEKSRSSSYKSQRDQARHERDQARKWYRSWTFGFVVGVVTVSAAAVAIAYASRK